MVAFFPCIKGQALDMFKKDSVEMIDPEMAGADPGLVGVDREMARYGPILLK